VTPRDHPPANFRELILLDIMDDSLPAVGPLTPVWVDYFIMLGVFALIAIGALVWAYFLRKPGRRQKRQRADRHRLNPTLAEIGGLPPARPDHEASGPQPPTPTSPP
jgi:hypothetical protein